MKLFKKLAVLVMSLTLCVGFGATVAACGKDDKPTAEQPAKDGYSIKVLDTEGNPFTDCAVSICTADGVYCSKLLAPNAKGTAVFSGENLPTGGAAEYVVHVYNEDMEEYDLTGDTTTPAEFPNKILTVTVNGLK